MTDVLPQDAGASAPAQRATSAGGPSALVYVRDEDSESVVRQALGDLRISDVEYKTGGVVVAITELSKKPAPRLLIVDASGLADPAAAVSEVIGLCVPSTAVLVIGDSNDIRLYRELLDAGASEYFFKPLVTSLVSRACADAFSSERDPAERQRRAPVRKGKLILVVGARGGVGATTIAVRTAWGLAEHPPRPVAFVDLDLQFGDAALQMGAVPNHALREGLAMPDRVDDLFMERGLIPITERLDLLASLESLEQPVSFEEDALMSLLENLRHRYRYVVVDLPTFQAVAFPRVVHLPSMLLLVSDASLASARDVARLNALIGPNTPERTTMHILNKNGSPGSLPIAEFARGAGAAADVVIPWSRQIGVAGNEGVKAAPDCPALDSAMTPLFARVAGERGVAPSPSWLKKLLG